MIAIRMHHLKKKTNNILTDVVPRIDYEEKEQECLEKDEQIQILTAKIRRLEHLLHLKDIRIQDLTGRDEKLPKTLVKK